MKRGNCQKVDLARQLWHRYKMQPRLEEIRLEIGQPSHGWLPIRLRLDECSVEIYASDVLNDPLEELIDCVKFCRGPSYGQFQVCLWIEPACYILEIQIDPGDEIGLVKLSYDDDFTPMQRGRPGQLLIEAQAELPRMARAFSSGLGQFFHEIDSKALVDHWRSSHYSV